MNTASSSLAVRPCARAGAAKADSSRNAAFRGAYTTKKASAPTWAQKNRHETEFL